MSESSIRFSDISKDDDITIRAFTEETQVELKAVYSELNPNVKMKIAAVAHNSDFAAIELVRAPGRDNTVVLFADANCELEALVFHNGQLYRFDNVIVPRASINNSTIQIIMGNHPGLKYNRRRAYRVSLGLEGMLQLENGQIATTVRDLSVSGVGIVVPKGLDIEVGQDVRVQFSDYIYVFDLKSQVVRISDMGKNYKNVGLALYPMKSENVERYIAKKQVDYKKEQMEQNKK
ncbi:MAG: PilZ domain-containing protein [Lachnospiraceae bacterium]|nr:PilZ domain-containing protein [Lachnospiraceae bacterium]